MWERDLTTTRSCPDDGDDSGDHLHLSDSGYESMAGAVELELFRTEQSQVDERGTDIRILMHDDVEHVPRRLGCSKRARAALP